MIQPPLLLRWKSLNLSPIHFFNISSALHRKASLPLPHPPPPTPITTPTFFLCSVRIFNPSPVSLYVFLLPGFYSPLAPYLSIQRTLVFLPLNSQKFLIVLSKGPRRAARLLLSHQGTAPHSTELHRTPPPGLVENQSSYQLIMPFDATKGHQLPSSLSSQSKNVFASMNKCFTHLPLLSGLNQNITLT